MALKQQIVSGQRYRDTQSSRLAPGAEWIVASLHIGTDGIEYASLVSAADPTRRKTLSVTTLRDRRRFEQVSA